MEPGVEGRLDILFEGWTLNPSLQKQWGKIWRRKEGKYKRKKNIVGMNSHHEQNRWQK